MKITKYEHACLVVSEGDTRLIIDPGMFVKDFSDHQNVCGIIITHEHEDHFDKATVKQIVEANPNVKIFSVEAVAKQLTEYSAMTVKPMETVACGPYELAFYGGKHALVHANIPQVENVGVLVNKTLYYPGDSFSLPEGATPYALAVPTSGPWLKTGEAIDFVLAVKPKIAFATHDVHASDAGAGLTATILGATCQSIGAEYKQLATGESLSV